MASFPSTRDPDRKKVPYSRSFFCFCKVQKKFPAASLPLYDLPAPCFVPGFDPVKVDPIRELTCVPVNMLISLCLLHVNRCGDGPPQFVIYSQYDCTRSFQCISEGYPVPGRVGRHFACHRVIRIRTENSNVLTIFISSDVIAPPDGSDGIHEIRCWGHMRLAAIAGVLRTAGIEAWAVRANGQGIR
jgi:hypothetical protein